MRLPRLAAFVGLLLLVLTGFPVVPADTTPTPSPIDGCTTVSKSGAYLLTEDVTNSTASACVRVRADDVVLDGGGHVVDGSSTTFDWRQKILGGTDYNAGIGVVAVGDHRLTNVTVRNLTVTEWETGLAFENVSRASVRYVEATRSDTGILLQNASDGTVYQTPVARNVEDGLELYRADDVGIRAVEARQNHFAGIAGLASASVSCTDAAVVGNHGDGVVLVNGTRHRLANVTAADNTVGLFLLSTDDSRVRHGESRGNSFAGILLARATDNHTA